MERAPFWFRLLLKLLPARFRNDHRDELFELIDLYGADARLLQRALLWLRAGADVIAVAARMRGRAIEESVARNGGVDAIGRDIRYAWRSLGRDKAFTGFVVAILGLGVGACVTVFSVVNTLFLRPLPFEEPDRLVWVSNGDWGQGQALSSISVQSIYLEEIQSRSSQIETAGGFYLFDRVGDRTMSTSGGPQRVSRLQVTAGLLETLGVQAMHGRNFSDDELRDEAPRAIMLTHGFWQRAFGSDPSVVGRVIRVDGAPVDVIGVLPKSFAYEDIFAPGRRVDYVAPWALSSRNRAQGNALGLIARLTPDATVESAQAEISALVAGQSREGGSPPTATRDYWLNEFRPSVQLLRDHVTAGYASTAMAIVAAVFLVMLIVCANISNLLLARGSTRRKEMAVRAALGAEKGRLVRQMLTESLLLAGIGAALATVLAVYGTGLLSSLDLRIPLLGMTSVDASSVTVAVAVALTIGLLFGALPAMRTTQSRLHDSLKDGSRGASRGRQHTRVRNGLVIAEIALACVLLVASTLTVRSLFNLIDTDLGYSPDSVVAIRVDPSVRSESIEERRSYYTSILERVDEAPGVTAAGLSDILPMGFNRRWASRASDRLEEDFIAPYVRLVSEGYLEAMGATVVLGRSLTREDDADAQPVVLVNQTLASTLWPDRSPLGESIRANNRDWEVVGVVGDTRQLSVEQEAGNELFFPMRQVPEQSSAYLMVRGTPGADVLVAEAQRAVRRVDASVPVDDVTTLETVVAASLAPRRFLVILMTAFAGFALILASLGTFGVISYSVNQRKREIGVRIALGASGAEVTRRVVRETWVLAALGLGIGLCVSAAASRLMASLLYETPSLDPATYLAVAVILGGVATAAGYLPARRAGATSPLVALTGDERAVGST